MVNRLRVYLFAPGHGLLRWRMDHDVVSYSYYEPPEHVCYIPPLRFAAIWLRSRIEWVLRGGGWYRQTIPTFTDDGDYVQWYRAPRRAFFFYYKDWLLNNRDPDYPEWYL
jgi:hypothetical protein